jgi:hypothetical protein
MIGLKVGDSRPLDDRSFVGRMQVGTVALHPQVREEAAHPELPPIFSLLDGLERRDATSWTALCPHHGPPKLVHLRIVGDKILVKCQQRGCTTERLLGQAGITMEDLYLRQPPERQRRVYRDESGDPVYAFKPFPHKKGGYYQSPGPLDLWLNGIKTDRKVLYRLPELLSAASDSEVWCCQREWDADSAGDLGMIATTAYHDAWARTELDPLQGKDCVIICAHTTKGWISARKREDALQGTGAHVVEVLWPRKHEDLSDLVASAEGDLEQVRAGLEPVSGECPIDTEPVEKRMWGYARIYPDVLTLSARAIKLYLVLNLLGGASGWAHYTPTEYARDFGGSENTARKYFSELLDAGYITKDRRGWYEVYHPQISDKKPMRNI